MPSQNGIMGDLGNSFDLPENQVSEADLQEIRHLAKFSKSKEFQKLSAHLNERVTYYQQYLPDGRAVKDVPKKDLDSMWIAANVIIGELKTVLTVYEQASEAVKEIERVRRTAQ
jgi:hypothetical protein